MSSVPRSRNILPRSWSRIAAATLAALVLTAVPALAITRLGAGMFSSHDTGEAQGAREVEAVASSPLTFDAPTLTVMRASFVDRAALAASGAKGEETEPAMVVDDWKFTRVWRHRMLVPIYIFNSTTYNYYNYGNTYNYYGSAPPGTNNGGTSGNGGVSTLIQQELQLIQMELMQIQLLQQLILTELSQLRQFFNRHSHSW